MNHTQAAYQAIGRVVNELYKDAGEVNSWDGELIHEALIDARDHIEKLTGRPEKGNWLLPIVGALRSIPNADISCPDCATGDYRFRPRNDLLSWPELRAYTAVTEHYEVADFIDRLESTAQSLYDVMTQLEMVVIGNSHPLVTEETPAQATIITPEPAPLIPADDLYEVGWELRDDGLLLQFHFSEAKPEQRIMKMKYKGEPMKQGQLLLAILGSNGTCTLPDVLRAIYTEDYECGKLTLEKAPRRIKSLVEAINEKLRIRLLAYSKSKDLRQSLVSINADRVVDLQAQKEDANSLCGTLNYSEA